MAAAASGSADGAGTALLFPGQGAQSVGMLGGWCDGHSGGLDLFSRASSILGYDLAAICRGGPAERLNSTAVAQPAILVTSLAALAVLRDRDPAVIDACTLAAGLSLGEYTALVFAGAIEFDDAVRLVDVRGRAMQACADDRSSEPEPGGMVAVLGPVVIGTLLGPATASRPSAGNAATAACSRSPTCSAPATSSPRDRGRPADAWRPRRSRPGR